MRIRITIDVLRHPAPEPHEESAPDVDAKSAADIGRRPQADFDPMQRIGFMCNDDRPERPQETTP